MKKLSQNGEGGQDPKDAAENPELNKDSDFPVLLWKGGGEDAFLDEDPCP